MSKPKKPEDMEIENSPRVVSRMNKAELAYHRLKIGNNKALQEVREYMPSVEELYNLLNDKIGIKNLSNHLAQIIHERIKL